MTTTRVQEPRTEPEPRRRPVRRVVKWLGIAVAVLVVAVAAWWVLASTGKVPAPTPITVDAASAQQTATVDSNTANGCLGGTDPNTAILAAHDTAALDTFGAAGFARTFTRWAGNVPIDPAVAAVIPQVTVNTETANQLLTSMTAYDQRVTGSGYTADGAIPGGSDDVYRIVNADPAGASITVTVVTHRQSTLPDGSHTPVLRSITTVILDVVNGHWVVAGSQPQPDNPYAPISGVPWVQFVGTC